MFFTIILTFFSKIYRLDKFDFRIYRKTTKK